MPKNPPFYYFDLFSIVLLTPFFNKPDSSSDLTVFMISFISSSEIINVVMLDSQIFFWIAAPVADAAAVNPKRIITLLANDVSAFFIIGKATFIHGARKLSNLPSWLLIFIVDSVNKIPLFSKGLTTFIISFI